MSDAFFELLAHDVITSVIMGEVKKVNSDNTVDIRVDKNKVAMDDSKNRTMPGYVALSVAIVQLQGVIFVKPKVGMKALIIKGPNILHEFFGVKDSFDVKVSNNAIAVILSPFNSKYKSIPADVFVDAALSVFGVSADADYVASADKVDGRLLSLVAKINTIIAQVNINTAALTSGSAIPTQAFLTTTAVDSLKAS